MTAFKKPPFRIEEKGWGEFDMTIVLTGAYKGGDHTLAHDLNFQSEKYEATHQVVRLRSLHKLSARTGADQFAQVFRNPKPDLMALLEQSGGDANGVRGKSDASKKKARRDKAVRLAICIRLGHIRRLIRNCAG